MTEIKNKYKMMLSSIKFAARCKLATLELNYHEGKEKPTKISPLK